MENTSCLTHQLFFHLCTLSIYTVPFYTLISVCNQNVSLIVFARGQLSGLLLHHKNATLFFAAVEFCKDIASVVKGGNEQSSIFESECVFSVYAVCGKPAIYSETPKQHQTVSNGN